jgi:hypothetical protein
MSPKKSLDLLIDEVIDNQISAWIEDKHQDDDEENPLVLI